MADHDLNPFSDDIFDASLPDFSQGDVEWIHLPALVRLKHALASAAGRKDFGPGRIALISAPRAGFGKSHLVASFERLAGDGSLSLPLRFDPDWDLTWDGLLSRTLSELHGGSEPENDCTLLDGIGRRIFASATRQMIAESKIPSADPVEAMAALDRDPVGLFDLGGSAQVVGHWFNQYFDQLLPTVAGILARRCGIPMEKAKAWAQRFHGYATLADDQSRLDAFQVSLPRSDESSSKQSLHEFLRLTTSPRPAVLKVDDLDGFYRNRDAGQRLAHMLLEVAKMSPKAVVVIAANEDLWEASFGLHIASAYEDRLTAKRVRLGGLEPVRAKQLVRDRLLRAGKTRIEANDFDSYLALDDLFASPASAHTFSPRDILRYASIQWDRYRAGEPSPATPTSEAKTAPASDPGNQLAPMPTPPAPGEGAESALEDSPTGTEIFDKLTRDSINEAAQNLIGSNSVTKAPPAPAEKSGKTSPVSKADDVEDVVPELVGHTQPAAPEPSGKNGNSGNLTAPEPTSQAAFSEDEDNPFQKLKQMLSKLRAEREVQRQSDSPTLVEAERKRIESETGEPESKSDRQDSSRPPAVSSPRLPVQEKAPYDPDEPTILTEFRRERDLILRAGTTLPIIQSSLSALARAAGERFPVVTFDTPEIGENGTAVRWSFDDTEILFGTSPSREKKYWDQLGIFAKSRAKDGKANVKMIVFSSADDPIDVDTILGGTADLIGIADFTVLDRMSLASLYAAHRLITGETAGGDKGDQEEHGADDVLGKLAGELDFFWKRVTRPLPGTKEIAS